MTYIPALPIYPPEFSWIRQETEVGGIYVNETGTERADTSDIKNGRIVYFAADIDRCFGKYLLPDHRRLLCNAVKWAAGGSRCIHVEAEGEVCCNAYAKEDRLLIHLVNLTGGGVPTGTLEHAIPIRDVRVMFDCGDIVEKVAGTVNKESYHWSVREGMVQVEIPVLKEQEFLVIDVAPNKDYSSK